MAEPLTPERCRVCDRPEATPEQWATVPGGERDDLCWGDCEHMAVDWRARYDAERAAHEETQRAAIEAHQGALVKAERERDEARAALETVRAELERERGATDPAECERDAALARAEQAEAALVGLREAANSTSEAMTRELVTHDGDPADFVGSKGTKRLSEAHHVLDAALASTPADLAARVRARHRAEALRDAADWAHDDPPDVLETLLRDEARAEEERAK